MTTLLDFGNELGLPLRGLHLGSHYGWTTDRAKAETMAGAGATVKSVPSHDLRPDARKFDGYEISFLVGQEVSDAGTRQE